MIRTSALVLAVCASTAAVAATAASAQTAAPSEAANVTPAPYILKNRSAFHLPADERAPFWPIGWQKPPDGVARPATSTQAPVERQAPKILIQPHHFSITTILASHPPLATINGRTFGEGELLPVVAGNQRLRVIVAAIRDGGVTLQQDERKIFVPLKRPEILSRPEQQKVPAPEFNIPITGN